LASLCAKYSKEFFKLFWFVGAVKIGIDLTPQFFDKLPSNAKS